MMDLRTWLLLLPNRVWFQSSSRKTHKVQGSMLRALGQAVPPIQHLQKICLSCISLGPLSRIGNQTKLNSLQKITPITLNNLLGMWPRRDLHILQQTKEWEPIKTSKTMPSITTAQISLCLSFLSSILRTSQYHSCSSILFWRSQEVRVKELVLLDSNLWWWVSSLDSVLLVGQELNRDFR